MQRQNRALLANGEPSIKTRPPLVERAAWREGVQVVHVPAAHSSVPDGN